MCDNFETGLSGHHELISTIMKSGNFKGPLKQTIYGPYRNFNLDVFNNTVNMELHSIGNNNPYGLSEGKFVLTKQAPLKTKLLHYNNKAFISKELRKRIMIQSKLKNTFNKNRSYEN